MRFGLGFSVLAEFVSKAYETATRDDKPSSILEPRPIEEQQVLDDIQKKLLILEQFARKQSDPPLQRFARALEQAWTAKTQGLPVEPKALEQFEKDKRELQSGDGFGKQRQLPSEVDQVLTALRGAPSPQPGMPAPAILTPEGEPDLSDADLASLDAELAAAEAELSAEHPGESLFDESGNVDDERVKAFVQKYYSEEFEEAPQTELGTPQSEEELLAQMPDDAREHFMKMPPAERSFMLTADPTHQIVHAQMPPDEAKFFAGLKPDQRGQYLAMSADEKKFFRTLNPDQRALYLSLNTASRADFRAMTPQQRTTKASEWTAKQTQDAGRPIEEVAPKLADAVMAELGLDPVRDGGLREKARALAFNYLKQTPNDRAAAETGLKKALLQDPAVLEPLLDDLEDALDAEPTATDAAAVGSRKFEEEGPEAADTRPRKPKEPPRRARVGEYTQHFARIRQTLPQLAQQMVQPGLTRDQMIEGMKNAVVVSAELAVAYPRRGKPTRASAMFGKRPIVA